jgi:hypothetical protein
MPTPIPTLSELPLRKAMEERDLVAATNAFAADAVFNSPFTDKLVFRGREQIAALTRIVLEDFDDFRYTAEVRTEKTAFLVARAKVDGQEIEIVDHLRLNRDGQVEEMTVFFRPLPAAATALRVLGAGLGRRRSATRGAIVSALARPLGLMTRLGDGLGVRLVRPPH